MYLSKRCATVVSNLGEIFETPSLLPPEVVFSDSQMSSMSSIVVCIKTEFALSCVVVRKRKRTLAAHAHCRNRARTERCGLRVAVNASDSQVLHVCLSTIIW